MLRNHVSVNSGESVNIVEPGRREFLKNLLGAGALVLSVRRAPANCLRSGNRPCNR